MAGLVKQTKKAPSPLAMHSDSHKISKFRPKIRIVHLFAPEIIKTDVANFRSLVQRLTGKPSEEKKPYEKRATSSTTTRSQDSRTTKTTTESEDGYQSSGCFNKIKYEDEAEEEEEEEEETMWGGETSSSSGCFFNGLGDIDEFIKGLVDFPLLPFNNSSLFGDSPLG